VRSTVAVSSIFWKKLNERRAGELMVCGVLNGVSTAPPSQAALTGRDTPRSGRTP
jgi:hypothetical protein